MDRSSGYYQFDSLLNVFIYDRLMAKIVRATNPDTAGRKIAKKKKVAVSTP